MGWEAAGLGGGGARAHSRRAGLGAATAGCFRAGGEGPLHFNTRHDGAAVETFKEFLATALRHGALTGAWPSGDAIMVAPAVARWPPLLAWAVWKRWSAP